MPGDHSKSGPPSTERRQASTCTGNLRVVTRPAESMASTQMLTSPATSGVQGQDAEGSPWRIDPQRDQPPCSQTNLYLTEPALPETDRPSSHSSPSRGDPPSVAFAERPSREKSSDNSDILIAGSTKRDEAPRSVAKECEAAIGQIKKATNNARMSLRQTVFIGIRHPNKRSCITEIKDD